MLGIDLSNLEENVGKKCDTSQLQLVILYTK